MAWKWHMISATGSFCNHAAAICGQQAAQRLPKAAAHHVLWRQRRTHISGYSCACCGAGAERHDSLAKLLNTNPPVMGEASAPKRLDRHRRRYPDTVQDRGLNPWLWSWGRLYRLLSHHDNLRWRRVQDMLLFGIAPFHSRYCALRMA